jgi:hypothetical protein
MENDRLTMMSVNLQYRFDKNWMKQIIKK